MDVLHKKQEHSHSMTQNIPDKAGPGKNAWLWKTNKQTKNGWEQGISFTKWAWVISEYALGVAHKLRLQDEVGRWS